MYFVKKMIFFLNIFFFSLNLIITDSNLESRNRGIYPARWYRKRFRTGARKNVLYNTVLIPDGDHVVAPSSPGIFTRAGPEVSYSHNDGQKASTLFDDIFNVS